MRNVCRTLFFIALLNFAIFFCVAMYLGGDAVNGKIQNGKWFVGNHGRYTEVSEVAYTYSRYHVYSLWITHPIGIIAMILWSIKENKLKKANHAQQNTR